MIAKNNLQKNAGCFLLLVTEFGYLGIHLYHANIYETCIFIYTNVEAMTVLTSSHQKYNCKMFPMHTCIYIQYLQDKKEHTDVLISFKYLASLFTAHIDVRTYVIMDK